MVERQRASVIIETAQKAKEPIGNRSLEIWPYPQGFELERQRERQCPGKARCRDAILFDEDAFIVDQHSGDGRFATSLHVSLAIIAERVVQRLGSACH